MGMPELSDIEIQQIRKSFGSHYLNPVLMPDEVKILEKYEKLKRELMTYQEPVQEIKQEEEHKRLDILDIMGESEAETMFKDITNEKWMQFRNIVNADEEYKRYKRRINELNEELYIMTQAMARKGTTDKRKRAIELIIQEQRKVAELQHQRVQKLIDDLRGNIESFKPQIKRIIDTKYDKLITDIEEGYHPELMEERRKRVQEREQEIENERLKEQDERILQGIYKGIEEKYDRLLREEENRNENLKELADIYRNYELMPNRDEYQNKAMNNVRNEYMRIYDLIKNVYYAQRENEKKAYYDNYIKKISEGRGKKGKPPKRKYIKRKNNNPMTYDDNENDMGLNNTMF